jgi:hypothetical protein
MYPFSEGSGAFSLGALPSSTNWPSDPTENCASGVGVSGFLEDELVKEAEPRTTPPVPGAGME